MTIGKTMSMSGRRLDADAASSLASAASGGGTGGGIGAPLRARLARLADALVAAVAVSLPWSTSATSVLIVLWLIALLPTLDIAAVRREVMSAAGGLPVLLWVLGALGMLWADASWSERVEGVSGFHKLLMVPLLLAQFRRSGQAQWVALAFLASSGLLLVISWALALTPGLTWRGKDGVGVPVKDYILQSAIFAICAFGLIGQAAELWRSRLRRALLLLAGAALFIANILFVVTARTTLAVMVVLVLLLGLRRFGWKGALGACLAGCVLAGAAWASSPHLREQVSRTIEHVRIYGSDDTVTSVGSRLEFWQKSLRFVGQAPLIGHGTGTIPKLFQRSATAATDPLLITDNPHNQLLTVAIQLGALGAALLIAMWIAHLVLFRDPTLVAWLGLSVVAQNVVGSLFNSHLFDFGHGWLYVFGVGIAGGTVLGRRPAATAVEGKP
jgi:O-antigen ligase